MSTILEALRELESGRPPGSDAPAAGGGARRSWWVAAAVALGALGAGGSLAFLVVMPGRAARALQTGQPAAPVAASGSLPLAAPATPPASLLDADPPRARVGSRAARADTAEPPAKPAKAARTERTPRVAGEPRLSIAHIAYTAAADERTVELAVGGATPVTLHQGESAGDVEVQLILADRIYVRHAGQIFAVGAAN